MQEQRLEDVLFFQNVLARDPNKGKMAIKLCRLLNKLVPSTLSFPCSRDMNCFEMSKKYPNGAYWSKASLFVVANNTEVGQFVWDELQKDHDGFQEVTHPLLSKDLCDKFKDVFQVSKLDHMTCGLKNCVLEQVHIFPSMMFQWWISCSQFLLNLEVHVADFYHLKFPQYLHKTVQSVVDLVEKVRFYLNLGLQCLLLDVMNGEKFSKKHYEIIVSETVVLIIYYFEHVNKILNAIMCLKRMCWSESSAREVIISPGLKKQRDRAEHLKPPCKHEFILPILDALPASVFMREQLVTCTGCSSCKKIIQAQKIKDFEDAKKLNQNLSLEALNVFICHVLIRKGRFLAEDQEALFRHAYDPEIWKLLCKWLSEMDLLGSETLLDEADKGPFYDVLVCAVRLEQAHLEAAISERLTTLSGIKSVAENSKSPDMTLEEIEQVFKDIELIPPWTFEMPLIKSQINVDKSNQMCNLNDNSQCVDYYSSRLEIQIRSLGLRITQKSLNCFETDADEVLDVVDSMHFIQFLLPCFLASYFELKEDKRVSLKARNFYLNFIKQLLKIWDDEIQNNFYFKGNTVCFLKWKFETVFRDLEGMLYNNVEVPSSNSSQKIEEGHPPFITSSMKSDCFDVLTDFLGRKEDQTYFLRWKKQLYMFSNSLQSSLFKLTQKPPGFSWKWGAELKAMSTLSRLLAIDVFKGLNDTIDFDHTNLLLGAIFKAYAKSEKLMVIRMMPGATKKNTWSDFQAKVETESLKLNEHQQLALALYMCLSSSGLKADETQDENICAQTIDAVERAYNQIKAGKDLKVQQTLTSWQRDEQGVNLAQVSYNYAMEVAPLCYSVVTCRLTKDIKIQMKEPGEITFCPVRHCRWCGQVETEQKELFVCQFCKDIPEYPDVNLFCSLDCEEKTLDKKHRQEHTEVVEMQLGLRDVEQFMENLSLAPNCLEQLEPNLTDEDKEFSKNETDDLSLEGEVGALSSCGKCLNIEPKEELYVVCKGGCKRRFHLECIGVVDSGGNLKDFFLPLAWRCEKCLNFSVEAIERSSQNDSFNRKMDLLAASENAVRKACSFGDIEKANVGIKILFKKEITDLYICNQVFVYKKTSKFLNQFTAIYSHSN